MEAPKIEITIDMLSGLIPVVTSLIALYKARSRPPSWVPPVLAVLIMAAYLSLIVMASLGGWWKLISMLIQVSVVGGLSCVGFAALFRQEKPREPSAPSTPLVPLSDRLPGAWMR